MMAKDPETLFHNGIQGITRTREDNHQTASSILVHSSTQSGHAATSHG